MEHLKYSIFILDDKSKSYSLLYENSNIYSVINVYSTLIKKFKNNCIKVCSELQIYNGDSYDL